VEVVLVAIAVLAVLALLGWFGRAVFNNPRGDFESGMLFVLSRAYVQAVHALRVRGRKRLAGLGPEVGKTEPLIVVCNHTAGLDPMLVQVSCPFFIRWMMAQDMRASVLEWFWRFWQVIFVDRERRDSGGVRLALRHLQRGGVIGIFPEGALERPARQLLPFQAGAGLLIRKSGARVLTVTIEDTPQYDPAWASLWHFSRSRIHFREVIDYSGTDLSAQGIADDLRHRFANYLGWTTNDTVPSAYDSGGGGSYGHRASA
jgi:1-acyl-sn-glycerol-3-phosphate acyltransferase